MVRARLGLGVALVGLAVSGCYDWDKALQACVSQNRCEAPDSGQGGGGGDATGGGTGGGGGTPVTGGGGGDLGGGTGGGGDLDSGFTYGDAGTFAIACLSDGFCWENPFPLGNDLSAVSSIAAGDAWAVGEGGAAVHLDTSNAAYTYVNVTAPAGVAQQDYRLVAIAAGATGVYATDVAGQVLEIDPHAGSATGAPIAPEPIASAVWITPGGLAWVGGADGGDSLIAQVNPSTLACSPRYEAPGAPIVSLDGTAAWQLAITADGGLLQSQPDGGFAAITVAGLGTPIDLAVVDDGLAFACGSAGVATFGDGGATNILGAAPCRAAAVASPAAFTVEPGVPSVFVWSLSPLAANMTLPLSFAPNDVSALPPLAVMVGDDGHFATANATLERVADFALASRDVIADLWVEEDGGAWAVSSGGNLLRRAATSWSAFDAGTPFQAIEKLDDTRYLVGGVSGAYLLTDAGLSPMTFDAGAGVGLARISTSPAGAWAVSNAGHVYRFVEPSGWDDVFQATDGTLSTVWAAPDGPVFAAGLGAAIDGGSQVIGYQYTNGNGWTELDTSALQTTGQVEISGTSSTDVWFVAAGPSQLWWQHSSPKTNGVVTGPSPLRGLAFTASGSAEAWASTGRWHVHFHGGTFDVLSSSVVRTPARMRAQGQALWLTGERGTMLRKPQ